MYDGERNNNDAFYCRTIIIIRTYIKQILQTSLLKQRQNHFTHASDKIVLFKDTVVDSR